MQPQKALKVAAIAIGITAGGLWADSKPSFAIAVRNGWHYSIDATNDSTPFQADGNGLFEIYGSAYQIVDDTVIFAINSNVDLENGVDWDDANDDKVHFGDLLINFTGKSLDEANGELYGVRFVGNNDSGVSGLGVYSDVTAVSVADFNDGWSSLESYNNAILTNLVTPSHGDLAYDDSYFDVAKQTLNSIGSGNKIGDIELIADLTDLGLEFDYFGPTGSETIAFSFELGLFAIEDVQAMFHFAMECNNDIVAGEFKRSSQTTDVPTPAVILPAIFGMFGAASRRKSSSQENV